MKILKTRNDILKTLPENLKIAEIGVFIGDFSKEIYKITNPKELVLIDLFKGQAHSGDKDGENIIYANLEEEYLKLIDYFKYDRVKIIKDYSYNALSRFKDNYFDFIYIDGDHSYKGVKRDLELAFLKVKPNGYIVGHDYNIIRFPGLVKAVDEFCQLYNLKIEILTEDKLPSYVIKNIK